MGDSQEMQESRCKMNRNFLRSLPFLSGYVRQWLFGAEVPSSQQVLHLLPSKADISLFVFLAQATPDLPKLPFWLRLRQGLTWLVHIMMWRRNAHHVDRRPVGRVIGALRLHLGLLMLRGILTYGHIFDYAKP